jgi:hypothetical protein
LRRGIQVLLLTHHASPNTKFRTVPWIKRLFRIVSLATVYTDPATTAAFLPHLGAPQN